MAFAALGISEPILEGIKAMGYTEPTPVQLRAIPLMFEGRDVIGSAQTGTGKTAAFGLPILSRVTPGGKGPHVLILVPTRELAAQTETAFRDFTRFTEHRIGVVYGGAGYGKQNDLFRDGVDVLIATPGRLLDHIGRGTCNLREVRFLVLDEADRMLDMGFLPDVRRIIERCPKEGRQTALFSATIPPEIDYLTKWTMTNPEVVEIGLRRSPAETVKHAVYPVSEAQKTDLLVELLERVNYDSVMVFCRTKHGADRIGAHLKRANHAVAILHSNRTQAERERALNGFRDGKYEVLVATDIASRGLDVKDVSHVINYDVPQHPEDYVHRIGRTGRAQALGDALTLMVASDLKPMASIERFIGQRIHREKLEGFNYTYTALFDADKPGNNAGDRRTVGVRLRGGYYFGPAKRRKR